MNENYPELALVSRRPNYPENYKESKSVNHSENQGESVPQFKRSVKKAKTTRRTIADGFDSNSFMKSQEKVFTDLRRLGIQVKPIKFPFKKPPLFSDEKLMSMSDEDILQVIRSRPVNLGIITGIASGVVAVDTDSVEATEWAKNNLPSSPFKTITPKGTHTLYRLSKTEVRNSSKFVCPKSKKKIDLDIRGENGYVMAPGSLHPADHLMDKNEYKELSQDEQAAHAMGAKIYYQEEVNLSEINLDDLPKYSSKWFEKSENASVAEIIKDSDSDITIELDERIRSRVESYLRASEPAVEGEGGDSQTFKIACDLVVGFSLEKDIALELMLEHFNPKCKPEWSRQDLKKKIDNASDYSDLESGYLLREKNEKSKLNIKPLISTIGEFLKFKSVECVWLVNGLLPAQGVSLLFAKPKTGKTTLVHRLAVNVAEGTPFLSKKVQQGRVLLLNLEDNLQMKREVFSKYSKNAQTNISLFTGHYLEDPEVQLELMIKETKPALIVIDTIQKYLNVSDTNDYSLVYSKMSHLNNLSRKYNCHIILLHHANKTSVGAGFDSIMGSTAFRATVDLSISMTEENGHRFIMSEGRYGNPIPKTQIKFDPYSGEVEFGTMDDEDLLTENAEAKILNYLRKQSEETKYLELQEMVSLRKAVFLRAIKALEGKKINVVTRGKGKGVKYVSLVP